MNRRKFFRNFGAIIASFAIAQILIGCTVISNNRVFPKLSWCWSKESKLERQERRQHQAYDAGNTNWSSIK